MKNSKFLTITLISALTLALGFSVSLFAASDTSDIESDDMRPGMMLRKMAKQDMGLRLLKNSDKLGLSDEQEAQILELSQQFRTKIEAHQELMQPLLEQGKAMRQQEGFDEDAVRAHMEQVMPLMIDGRILRGQYRADIGEVLTDEQKAKVKAAREKSRERVVKRMKIAKERGLMGGLGL